MSPDTLSFRMLDVNVRVRCLEGGTRALLMAHYGRMRQRPRTAHLAYTIARPHRRLILAADGTARSSASDRGELLLLLDQDVIIQLQKLRPTLYFVHAGVLESAGKAVLLVAPSGGGKSTLVWGLLHHGFRYLSDELAPVDLRTLMVYPYPRAVTLKSPPPGAYPLPGGTLSTSRGFHVATAAIASGIRATAAPVTAIFFVRYAPRALGPSIQRISTGQASARLYANVLNALAHPEEGLDGAIRIASHAACFDLLSADLGATCALVRATLDRLPPRQPPPGDSSCDRRS